MNAKEFSCGLSDICNDQDPSTDPKKAKLEPAQVRQMFAFRYYDTSGEGLFDQHECRAFLGTYLLGSQMAVKSANDKFQFVYGLDDVELATVQSAQLIETRKAARQLVDDTLAVIGDFVRDVFMKFAPTGKKTKDGQPIASDRMDFAQFKAFAGAAPMFVDWLTDFGTTMRKSLDVLRSVL